MKVVYALTRNLYHTLFPAIRSLLEHNHDCEVIVMCEDDRLDGLPDQCRYINVSDQQYFTSGPNMGNYFTYMCMMRAIYAKYIDGDRVINLDVDTIVCDDLTPIWEVDLTEKHFAAVPEYRGRYKPYGDKYYNMGVAVHHLAQIRKDGLDDKALEILRTQYCRYLEQDVWNCIGKGVDLPVRYNECFATGYTDNPAVVHYAGVRNWWNSCTPRYEYFKKYL